MARKQNTFVKHAAIYGIGILLLRVVGFVLLPLYTRYLTPADFGILELIQRTGDVVVICLMIGGLRLAALTFYQQSGTEGERARVAATATVAVLLLLLLLGTMTVLGAKPLSTASKVNNPILLAFGLVAALLESTTVVPLALIQARMESVLFVVVTLAIVLVRIGVTVVAVVGFKLGVWGILSAQGFTSLIFGIGLTIRELRRGSFRPDWRLLKAIFRFALPFVPGGLCAFIINNGDRFVLIRTSTASELGIYSLAYKVALLVGVFAVTPLSQVWSVRMYDAERASGAPVVFGRMFTRIMTCYVLVGLSICLFAGIILRILAPAVYSGAAALVGPVVLAYYFANASMMMDAAFYVRRRTGLKPWIYLIATTVTIVLYVTWIPTWGAQGAAWATVGGFFVQTVATWMFSQRVLRVEYEWGRAAGPLLAAILLVGCERMIPGGLLGIGSRGALLIGWMAGVWYLGVVSVEDKLTVVRMAQAWLRRLRLTPKGA